MVNNSSLVNNTRNHETCFDAGFTVSDYSFGRSYQIDRLVSADPTDIECNIRISNRSRPKFDKLFYKTKKEKILKLFGCCMQRSNLSEMLRILE